MIWLLYIILIIVFIIIHWEITFYQHSDSIWITYSRTFNDMGKPHKVKYTKKLW